MLCVETEKTWIGLVASFSDDLVDDEFQVHLILIGHTGVGKTSLRKHLKNEPMDVNEFPTIIMESEFLYRESVSLEATNPFRNLKDALKCSGGKVFLTMWDTGGQPIFQDLLPCFARLKCMYGIVFRLPDLKNFESKPKIRPFDVNCKSVTSPFSNQDIFYRNLAFVQAYSCSMKERFENLPQQASSTEEHPTTTTVQYPAAVVVGTCKDMATESELNESATIEAMKNLNLGVSDFVDKNNVSVYPVPGITSSYIHEVDNTVSGKTHDKGIDYLRDNISRCAQESNTKIHRSWKVFEVRLKRLTYTSHVNLGVLPLIEAIAIGHECGVENPRSALMYFHEVGVFMWYHMSQRESLRSFLVIDPKTLLEVLSRVFCFSPRLISPELVDLIERGMITVDLFRSLLREKASIIDDSWFIAFLEEHQLTNKVIHPDQGICYFLPSLLSIEPSYEDSLSQPSASDVSPLFIVPQSGYIPTGMFTRLLTALAGVTYGSTAWRIPFGDCYLFSVCRNQFEFIVNNRLHVILSEFSKYIRIDTALCKNGVISNDLYFDIASTLDVQLQRIVPRWTENKEFTLTFLCRSEVCLPQSFHFVSGKDVIFQSDKFVTCSNGSKFHLHRSQEVWLKFHSHTGKQVYLCMCLVCSIACRHFEGGCMLSYDS